MAVDKSPPKSQALVRAMRTFTPRRDERITDCEATRVITSAFASLSADPLALHAA